MKTPRTRIARTIADQTLETGVTPDASREIAAYLLSEGRVGELNSLLRDIQEVWAERGHVEVIAASAHPLSEQVKADILVQIKRVYPNAPEIRITEVRDDSVIGGVRLSLPGRQLDLSVQSKLHKFKQLTSAGKD